MNQKYAEDSGERWAECNGRRNAIHRYTYAIKTGLYNGGRIGFDKGGIAKVVEYVNSLPDGTEVSTKDIRDFIEKNNIMQVLPHRNMIAGSAPGKERFKIQ